MENEEKERGEGALHYERSTSKMVRWVTCQEFARILYKSAYTDPEIDRFIKAAIPGIVRINQSREYRKIENESKEN